MFPFFLPIGFSLAICDGIGYNEENIKNGGSPWLPNQKNIKIRKHCAPC